MKKLNSSVYVKKILCLAFVALANLGHAQLNTAWLKTLLADPGYDSAYISGFKDDLVLTLVTSFTENNFSIEDVINEDVTFSTNLPASFGLAVDYKWLTLEVGSTLGRTGDPNKGYTRLQNFGFGITLRKIAFRNFYQRTQGYYLVNPEYFNPGFNPATDVYPHRDDVRTTVYYATMNYVFNHKTFSNTAALWQLERQKKSAGSFVSGLTYSYATYSADSALIAPKYSMWFANSASITSLYFNLFGANVGYVHTFAWRHNPKFFLSIGIIPGLSYQQASANFQEGTPRQNNHDLGIHAEGRLSAGYNGDYWYTAFSASGYSLSGRIENVNPYSQGYAFLRFVVGVRIKQPEKKLPFLRKLNF